MSKTIGFVDYYISEWHADNYPGWIAEVAKEKGKDFCVKCAWAEEYISPVDGKNTDQWCEEYGVEKCDTIAELCEKCDYIMVLSPSNPEKHLQYAQEVLKYKKNTYIDKTFAPDYAEAKEIFDIAEQYGTKFFSSSALRYATELDKVTGCENIITTGGGSSLEEYGIHQIEMIVKTLNETPISVKAEKQGNQYICTIYFKNNKKATMVYAESMTFSVCTDTKEGVSVYEEIESDFFKNLIADILDFFESGNVSFDCEETLKVMKIREGIIKAMRTPGDLVKL